jgi:amino acid transporter
MGLLQATATNIIGMVGVGPFLTIPFMVAAMGGPHILYAWAFGAVLALCDGLVYAELGAALPGSGGPYVYLREAYVRRSSPACRLAPSSGDAQPCCPSLRRVGSPDYLGFYWKTMGPMQHNVVAATLCVVVTALLYRDIASIGRLAVVMLVIVLATVGWVIVAGVVNASWSQAFDFPPEARRFDTGLVRAIGAAGLLAMYNYGGYNNVRNIGDELREPERTMPRAIVLSIVVVVALYVVMSTVVLGVVPWREAEQTRTIASLFIARTFSDPATGQAAALAMTVLILIVTASSLYAVVLGYSRIPYAAARDGQFFEVFGRLHPTKRFPHISLLTIGAVAIPFCFFTLGQLVSWLILVQILVQFVWQCAGVMLLRRYRSDIVKPFRMWLYPLPALVSLAMWIYIFVTAPLAGILFAIGFLAVAIAAYAIFRTAVQMQVFRAKPSVRQP